MNFSLGYWKFSNFNICQEMQLTVLVCIVQNTSREILFANRLETLILIASILVSSSAEYSGIPYIRPFQKEQMLWGFLR